MKEQLENSNDLNVNDFLVFLFKKKTKVYLLMKEFNLILKPLATCCEFLNSKVFCALFTNGISRVIDFIKKLDYDDSFKDKVSLIKTCFEFLKLKSIN